MWIPAVETSRLLINNGIASAMVLRKDCKAYGPDAFSLRNELNMNLAWKFCTPVQWGFLALAEKGLKKTCKTMNKSKTQQQIIVCYWDAWNPLCRSRQPCFHSKRSFYLVTYQGLHITIHFNRSSVHWKAAKPAFYRMCCQASGAMLNLCPLKNWQIRCSVPD